MQITSDEVYISSSTERSRLVNSQGDSRHSSLSCCSNLKDKFLSISREHWLLGLSVTFLMAATALERVTFKMAVDHMIPFRAVLVELIFVISLLIYSVITLIKRGFTNQITTQMKDFPHYKLMIMALLDTIQFGGLIVSAAGVSPTMTVILLHASTPCIVLGSRFTFPNREYTSMQNWGVALIALAVGVSITRPILRLCLSISTYSDALSAFLYVISAMIQGFATLYKEKSIIVWAQAMDIHYLSSWLFWYQCLAAIFIFPLIYIAQGISNDGRGFPLSGALQNIEDGWSCFWGKDPPTSGRLYDVSNADCANCGWLLVAYVLAAVVVIECIDRVLQISGQVLGRAMAAAVLVAFVALGFYDSNAPYDYGVNLFGTNIGFADIISIIVLLAGMEIYGRDPEPEQEAITNFSPSA